jgi:hypothetical protein
MMETVKVPHVGEMVQGGFGTSSLERRAETASSALAEQAKAQVQARYIMAMQRPRDLMQARQRLLDDCKRPGFADAAIYNKPVGDGIEGPSIRMAEAAARALTNIMTSATAIYDDTQKRIVHVSATDLEANLTYDRDITIVKTVERSRVPEGRRSCGARVNSNGKTVYTIEATDDEIVDKEGSLISKAMRTCLLRLVPGDLLDEAVAQCYETMRNRDAQDPAAATKAMCDAFGELGVTVEMLTEYLGHSVAQSTPDEMRRMRGTYNAIKNSEASWAQVVAVRADEKKPAPEKGADSQAASSANAKPAATLSDVAASTRAARGREPTTPGPSTSR